MRKITRFVKLVLILSILGILGRCDYFEYSPYAANVKDEYKNIQHINFNNLLKTDSAQKEEIKFAVIADSHYNYHELNEAIVNINARNDIDFVIANGDMSDHGYLKEYELFHKQMKKLKVPYLTVIGNHDYRSNGEKVYNQMYGKPNKSFTYNNNLFILFDNIFWESGKNPNMEWLEEELKKSTEYENVFILCHIPPYGDQFTDDYEERYKALMIQYGVDLSIHGHIHRFEYGEYYYDGIQYLAVGSIMDKEYAIITANEYEVEVKQIKY
ncbi:MAG: metallophosphoesterase [Bacteroidales bacterium]|nr:metallophosphoesterase [Bacteroidales bacterium]